MRLRYYKYGTPPTTYEFPVDGPIGEMADGCDGCWRKLPRLTRIRGGEKARDLYRGLPKFAFLALYVLQLVYLLLTCYRLSMACTRHNKWDPATKVSNGVFYLSDVANLWFKNHEAVLTTWEEFTAKIKEVFGRPAVRKLTAERKLNIPVQQPGETFTAYIEEVLQLCRRSNPDMTEKQKVNHILKGIAEDAFQLLATQSDLTVSKLGEACQNYQEIRQQRLTVPRSTTAVHTIASLAQAPDDPLFSRESLRSFIRDAVREEVTRILGTSTSARVSHVPSPPVAPPGIRSLIQEEVVAALGPVPRPPPPPISPNTPKLLRDQYCCPRTFPLRVLHFSLQSAPSQGTGGLRTVVRFASTVALLDISPDIAAAILQDTVLCTRTQQDMKNPTTADTIRWNPNVATTTRCPPLDPKEAIVPG
ncbi:hypothetical protein HPB47_000966 [Ixodes persulcatus]|uniref:Uncharacterized protein n=1 Tax=Ixodes persulcatus TaxID=34615 RepID=A0AC60PS86_IXOPE|nr:hypothetical protein HPB47_000966 [Ixodes persulcatus]